MIKWSISELHIIRSFQQIFFNQTEVRQLEVWGGGWLANIFVIMKTFLVLRCKKLKISNPFTDKEIKFIASMMLW